MSDVDNVKTFDREPLDDDCKAEFLEQLRIYLAAMYPGCPQVWRNRLLKRAARQGHFGRLGEIAGILTDTSARHRGTDYDRLLRINGEGKGLTREEARLVVAQEVRDIVAGWREGSAENDIGYRDLLKRLRKARGGKKRNKTVVLSENEALARYLTQWMCARESSQALNSNFVEAAILARDVMETA